MMLATLSHLAIIAFPQNILGLDWKQLAMHNLPCLALTILVANADSVTAAALADAIE